MPPGSKKRRNDKKKRGTALHEGVPANISDQVGVNEVKVDAEEGSSLLLDCNVDVDGDEDEASPISLGSKRSSSNSVAVNHQHPSSCDSICETTETGELLKMSEVSKMEGEGEKSEDLALIETKSEAANGDEKLRTEKIEVEFVEASNDDQKDSSSSSSDDESDHGKDKESDKPPEIPATVPEADGSEVVAVVEVPIQSSGLGSVVESRKQGSAEGDGGFSSSLANSIESAKGAIMESVNQSDFVSLVKSTKEEITEALALLPSTEVQQEVEKQAVILGIAEISSGEKSKDDDKSVDTTTKTTLPLPLAQRATWKSCCGLFDFFTGSYR